jgi:hypothetical protein
MKKFLFTLAALAMTMSVSAASETTNKFYIPDREILQSELNTNVWLTIRAHVDDAFNSFSCNLTYEGNFTHDAGVKKLAGAFNLPYVDDFGENATVDVSGNVMGNSDEFYGFCATGGYWDPNGTGDYVMYGSVKWEPAAEDYDFVQIRIKPAADFTGGTITVGGSFASGKEDRPINNIDGEAYFSGQVCHLTLEGAETPKTPFEATATIGDAEGYNVPLHYAANDPAAVVTVTVNGKAVDVTWDENGDATLVLGEAPDYGEYNIVLTVAVGNTEAYEGDDVTATKKVEIAQPAAPQPMISFNTQEDGSVTVVVTNATSYTITVNDQPWTAGDNIPQTYEDQVIVVNATNHIDGYVDNTNTATTTLEGKEKLPTVAPTITQQDGDAFVTVIVTPDPTTDGELVYNGEYSYPRGDQEYTVTVTAYTTEGATHQASATTTYVVVVPAKENPTSIDELINGKNVAGVRYFNMAGQEMSEANGMTIVVVTYTDGTTSAVKVMK